MSRLPGFRRPSIFLTHHAWAHCPRRPKDMSGAKVYLPKECVPGTAYREMTITGTAPQSSKCQKMLQELMAPPGQPLPSLVYIPAAYSWSYGMQTMFLTPSFESRPPLSYPTPSGPFLSAAPYSPTLAGFAPVVRGPVQSDLLGTGMVSQHGLYGYHQSGWSDFLNVNVSPCTVWAVNESRRVARSRSCRASIAV